MPGPPTFEPVVESRVKVSINGWKRSRDFGIKTAYSVHNRCVLHQTAHDAGWWTNPRLDIRLDI